MGWGGEPRDIKLPCDETYTTLNNIIYVPGDIYIYIYKKKKKKLYKPKPVKRSWARFKGRVGPRRREEWQFDRAAATATTARPRSIVGKRKLKGILATVHGEARKPGERAAGGPGKSGRAPSSSW